MEQFQGDYISIKRLCLYGYHGVLPEEEERGQEFYVNARLGYDMSAAARTDSLVDALDYAGCCTFIRNVFVEKRFALIEAAAEHLCRRLLLQYYPKLRWIELELCKPHAPIDMVFSDISVKLCRGWHRACLSIGSNMGDRRANLEMAVEELRGCPEIRVLNRSEWIETEPYGFKEQGFFLNGALTIDTIMGSEKLLDFIHFIEDKAGRVRKMHWGPRTLDLDIIFYDKLVYESERLVIPHVDMENRRFVLEPLAQIEPYLRHPVLGLTVTQMLERIEKGAQGSCSGKDSGVGVGNRHREPGEPRGGDR